MKEPPQGFSFLGLKDKLIQSKKDVLAFSMLLLIACALFGSTIFFSGSSVVKLFQIAGFLVIGYIHVTIIKGNLAALTSTEKLIYSLLLAIGIFIILSVVYSFSNRYTALFALANSCAFLLPYIMEELWRLFGNISSGEPMLWYYTDDLPMHKSTIFLNSIPIHFKVQMEQNGQGEYTIAFRAPVRMKLGLIFYHMMQEQNDNGRTLIDFSDEKAKPFGWLFFTPGIGGWNKYINPDTTLIENGIKQNAVIVARLISDKAILPLPGLQKELPNNIV
jgi:hypothetical protein